LKRHSDSKGKIIDIMDLNLH